VEFQDFSTSGVEKWRRQCFGIESLEIWKGWSDRWKESMSEIEDNGEDKWCVCRQAKSRLR
jgi:hypothetical protein